MNPPVADRLQAAGRTVTQVHALVAAGRFDEAEGLLAASHEDFERLREDLARPPADGGLPADPALLGRAADILPLVRLRELFAQTEHGAGLRPFFDAHADEPLTPRLVGVFEQEITRQTTLARDCEANLARVRANVERLEARTAILGRFVFLFRLQCLAESTRPGDHAPTAEAIAAELRTLGPLPPGGTATRDERWLGHERAFAGLLERLPNDGLTSALPPPTQP